MRTASDEPSWIVGAGYWLPVTFRGQETKSTSVSFAVLYSFS
ncbi:hypothetical protein ABT061_35675 [Streptosporangium sp. NPDC002544]